MTHAADWAVGCMQTGYLMAMGCRSLCSALVYDKTFTLSNSAWQVRAPSV